MEADRAATSRRDASLKLPEKNEVLQAEAAVGCRRLIAAAAASVVVVVLLLAAVVAAPAAFAPLARRDDSDAPAGAITGTRVRSIGVEAGRGMREFGKFSPFFSFRAFFLIDLGRKEK